MAATGKTPILLYGSTTPTNAPAAGNLTNSSDGCEIAINVADKNLFFKDSTNAVNTVPIRQSSASSNGWLSSTDWSTFNNKAPAFTYTSNYIPYGQGTTTPTQSANLTFTGTRFTIGGGTANYAFNSYANTGSTVAGAFYSSQAQTFVMLQDSGTTLGHVRLGSQSGDMIFWANNAEAGRWKNGNLVISTSGKGIDFSATAGTGTSELLADYEEGTWTPVPVPDSGSITSYSSSGYYTKVGRQVTVQFQITITNVGTATSLSNISGLPYTNNFNPAPGCGKEHAVTGNMWQYYIATGSSLVRGAAYNGNSTIATNYLLYGSITYFN